MTLVEDSEEVYEEHDYEVEADESEIEDRTEADDLLDANVDTAYAVGDNLFDTSIELAAE